MSSDDIDEMEDPESDGMCPLIAAADPDRDIEMPGFASRASARSNTLPWNADANDALCGVLDIVACMAGPSAALCGVIGVMGDRAPPRAPGFVTSWCHGDWYMAVVVSFML